jgi:hypothetical protein
VVADSYDILNRWKNYFSQLLNGHSVSNVRKMEMSMLMKQYITGYNTDTIKKTMSSGKN